MRSAIYRVAWTVRQEDDSLVILHGVARESIDRAQEDYGYVVAEGTVAIDAWIEDAEWRRVPHD